MTKANYFLFTFCLIFLIVKIISVRLTNFDLFGDEAQYWLWSQNIELGYFSKPPLLSWTVALVCLIFGNNIFVIKMISIILYCVTSYIIYLISYKLNKNVELAFLTAITFFVMPAVSVSSFLLSTDILLVFFWSLALLQLLIIKEKPSGLNFILLGIFIGLAFMSKYAAIYFVISMLILFFDKEMKVIFLNNLRKLLCLVIILVVIVLPNILWNINNGWTTFLHIADNAGLNRAEINFIEGLKFISSQILMVGPIIFIFYFFGYFKKIMKNFNTRFLLIFSLPIFTIVLVESILVRANANWAAVSLVSFIILFVHAIYNYSKKTILFNNIVNLIFGFVFFFLIGTSVTYEPFKRISGISSFANSLISGHNFNQTNNLVIGDRMLFSSLSYIFHESEIEMYVPFNPDEKLGHHFQITNPLPVDFNKSFVFIGYIDQLKYLKNKPMINLIQTKVVPFDKHPIQIYEAKF